MEFVYTGPHLTDLTCDVSLTKKAPEQDSFPMPMGVVLRRGQRGYVLPWSELVLHLGALLRRCPQSRIDVARMLEHQPPPKGPAAAEAAEPNDDPFVDRVRAAHDRAHSLGLELGALAHEVVVASAVHQDLETAAEAAEQICTALADAYEMMGGDLALLAGATDAG